MMEAGLVMGFDGAGERGWPQLLACLDGKDDDKRLRSMLDTKKGLVRR